MHLNLLECIANELLYAAPYQTPRRIYLACLPHLWPHFELLVMMKLTVIDEALELLLDSELDAFAASRRNQDSDSLYSDDEAAAVAAKDLEALKVEGELLDAAIHDSRSFDDLNAEAALKNTSGKSKENAEKDLAEAAAKERGPQPPMSRGLCDAIRCHLSIWQVAWPRAHAAADSLAMHAIGAYMRACFIISGETNEAKEGQTIEDDEDAKAALAAVIELLTFLCSPSVGPQVDAKTGKVWNDLPFRGRNGSINPDGSSRLPPEPPPGKDTVASTLACAKKHSVTVGGVMHQAVLTIENRMDLTGERVAAAAVQREEEKELRRRR